MNLKALNSEFVMIVTEVYFMFFIYCWNMKLFRSTV